MPSHTIASPVFLYAAPSKPAALHRPAASGAVLKFLQGAGAALLGYGAAGSITSPVGGAPSIADFTSAEDLTQAVLDGRLTGPAQLIAAAFLFIAAGRCNARLLGLIAGTALIAFHMQGVTLEQFVALTRDYAANLIETLSAPAGEAIRS